MNISINHDHTEERQPIEMEVSRHAAKLGRLLKTYAPDLVQLRGAMEKHPRRVEYQFSLNLSLPTGSMHATGSGPDVRLSVKQAFSDLQTQLKKHLSKLRKDYQWKRKRPRPAALLV